jgi:hypothetical protein
MAKIKHSREIFPPLGAWEKHNIFLAPWGRVRGPSRRDGKVRGIRFYSTMRPSGLNVAWIVSSTPSSAVNTSTFQNRNTRYPAASSARVRFVSSSTRSECCAPSSSMMSFASWLTKSTMYSNKGACRRNLKPSIWRLRSFDHRIASASVCVFRNERALACVASIEQSVLHSRSESTLKCLIPLTLPNFVWAPPSPPWGEENTVGWQAA